MSVSALNNLNFTDSQPTLEAPILGVLIDPTEDVNFVDAKAFVTRWTKELEELRNLEQLLITGKHLVHTVYAYRSTSDAISGVQIPPNDDNAMTQFYRSQYDALVPEVEKLKNFMKFHRSSQQFLRGVIASHQDAEHRSSESFLTNLVELIDILIKLDYMKNSKKTLETDFDAYQKVVSFLQNRDSSISTSQENHEIALFLGHDFSIINTLKTELASVDGFIRPITQILNMCVDIFETNRYVTPEEKFSLIRVIPTLIFFIDISDDPKKALTRTREHNISFAQKLLKRWPVVPLMGDMHIVTTAVLDNSPSFKYSPDFFAPPPKFRAYDLGGDVISSVRTQHSNIIATFREAVNTLRDLQSKNQPLPDHFPEHMTQLCIQGFQYLSEWSSIVLSHVAYKFAHPYQEDIALWRLVDDAVKDVDNVEEEKKDGDSGNSGKAATRARKQTTVATPSASALSKAMGQDSPTIAYERAVKYNYTSSERFLIVEFIGLIKGAAGVMLESNALLMPVIRKVIHNQIQNFVQHPIRDMIRRLSKKKKKNSERDELVELLNIVVDWKGGHPPVNDPILIGKKEAQPRQIPERSVPPTPTQIELLRNIIWGFINQRGHHDVFQSKAFDAKQIKIFEDIYEKSFFYKYLLDYEGTIGEVSSMADLWYREFHLEKSKQTQFSIELSIPWLLTNHVLEYAPKVDTGMVEFLLYPLSIYNDASTKALYFFKKKFLYDEVEAEVNLAMDQFIYKLSAHVFTYYKVLASSIMFDKSFAKILSDANPDKFFKFKVTPSRLYVLLEQRHFQLLGRTFDLNRIISQRINNYLRENTAYAITRFEASPITSVIAFENLLINIKITHFLLSQNLHHIDEWDVIYDEANESTSLISFHGRVALHVVFEILGDICSNFVYNSITQRFTRSNHVLTNRESLMRVSMPKSNAQFLYGNKAMTVAFAAVDGLSEKYFGIPHLKSVIRIMGLQTLPLVTSEIINNLQAKLKSVLLAYSIEIRTGIPKKVSLPLYEYGCEGNYGKFCGILQNIINYPVILEKVFQSFREWGNALVVLRLLDVALTEESVSRVVQAASVMGVKPDPVNGITVSSNTPLEKAFTLLNNTLPQQKGTQAKPLLGSFIQNARLYSTIYQPTLHYYSLFKSALVDVKNIVASIKDDWTANEQAFQFGLVDNVHLPIELSNEFHRVWSALLFVFCVDVPANATFGASSHEIFGDGFMWAGTTIVHFLEQRAKFELFDFSNHILRIGEVKHPTNEQMITFLHRISTVRDIYLRVFQVLETVHLCDPPKLNKFHPPTMAEEESLFTEVSTTISPVSQASPPTEKPLQPPKRPSGPLPSRIDTDSPYSSSSEHAPSPKLPFSSNSRNELSFSSSVLDSSRGVAFDFGTQVVLDRAPGYPPVSSDWRELGEAPPLPPDFFSTPAPALPMNLGLAPELPPELSNLGLAPGLPPEPAPGLLSEPAPGLPPELGLAPTLPPFSPAPAIAPGPAPVLPPRPSSSSFPSQAPTLPTPTIPPTSGPNIFSTPSSNSIQIQPPPNNPGTHRPRPQHSTHGSTHGTHSAHGSTHGTQSTHGSTHGTHSALGSTQGIYKSQPGQMQPQTQQPQLPPKSQPQPKAADDWDPFGENN